MEEREYQRAFGYAINAQQLFAKFPTKKMKIKRNECLEKYRCHRRDLATRIFKEAYKQVLTDIVDNNITFQLPGKLGSAEIRMKAHKGEEFMFLRKLGKYLNIDFLKSNFTGYQIYFFRNYDGYTIEKPIYLTHQLRDKIVENTNNGKVYG